MIAYYPMPKFLPVSISPCKLLCKHCMGKYLKGMKKIYDGEELLKLGEKKLNGVLISGGFDKHGKLQNLEKMLPHMKELRKKFCVALHPGFIDEEIASMARESIDIAFVDLPSANGIKNVYGLDATPSDYFHNMEYFIDAGVAISPHITAGLNYGKIEEWELLDMLKKYKIVKLVIDVIIPTKETPFENVSIDIEELREFFREARKKFKRIALGCMRPRRQKIDEIAYEEGIKEIALPSLKLLKRMENFEKRELCCGCP